MEQFFQIVSTERRSEDALSTAPDYPIKEDMEAMITCPPGDLPIEEEELDEESPSSDGEDDNDGDDEMCPSEKRSTRKHTYNFPGPHMNVRFTRQLIYHERTDMKKSSRHRHKSDENKVSRVDELVSDMRRGHKSMPIFQQKIARAKTPDGNLPSDRSQKPSFGCGFEGDDFTGLEDESPAISS